MAATRAARVTRLLSQARSSFAGCQCHGCSSGVGHHHSPHDVLSASKAIASGGRHRARAYATPVDGPIPQIHGNTDYAFEVAAANLRFGAGVTREVGMDFANMKARKVGVFTDPTVAKLHPMKAALESLEESGVPYEVFTDCKVEPTQESWQAAIDFARRHDFSHFLAVGGGSAMDTTKVADLFTVYPDADLLDFVNAPIGKGIPVAKTLRPLVAIPTTAGTGSETTGTAIFDYEPLKAKTGIASRALRPLLGIVDPENTASCPTAVHVSSGLDVLFHALESYTAIPYNERSPRPPNPINRPAYQGRNPISDVFSLWALKTTVEYLPRIAKDPGDEHARSQMLFVWPACFTAKRVVEVVIADRLAATFAGIGFGNAGVHLCHGFSYPISGLNKSLAKYQHPGYAVSHPIVPHGVSVALTGPSVFRFTAPSSPERHRSAAEIFGAAATTNDGVDEGRISDEDVGKLLHDRIARFLVELGMPRGLNGIGYKGGDIPELVKGTLPQKRVLDLAPGDTGEEALTEILEGAMKF